MKSTLADKNVPYAVVRGGMVPAKDPSGNSKWNTVGSNWNVTSNPGVRTLNPGTATVNDIANVLATLIIDLYNQGVITD
jgi:hypothetical protein